MALPWVAMGDHVSPIEVPWLTMDDHGIAMGCHALPWTIMALPIVDMGDHGNPRSDHGRPWHCHWLPQEVTTTVRPWVAIDDHGSAMGV